MTKILRISQWTFSSIMIALFLLTPACKSDIAFAEENKTAIDTMFFNRRNNMILEMDSLCPIVQAEFYTVVFDSILDVRIAQIEATLDKMKNRNQ